MIHNEAVPSILWSLISKISQPGFWEDYHYYVPFTLTGQASTGKKSEHENNTLSRKGKFL
jgi:hypothetical protein